MTSDQSAVLQGLLVRLAAGDQAARHELIGCAYERLRRLASVILNESFPRLKSAPAALETTALPDKEREVVDLLYFHGISQSDTAAILGVTERSVRRYWTAARLKLVQKLP